MGIDIYARWRGQTLEVEAEQAAAWLTTGAGGAGYLREAYHGEPYATTFLFAEAFATGEARIPAAVLRARLPHALALVKERERTLYQSSEQEIEAAQESYRAFVALCEAREKVTNEPVLIVASY